MNIEQELNGLKMSLQIQKEITQKNLHIFSEAIKNHEERMAILVDALNRNGDALFAIQELLLDKGIITKEDVEAKRVVMKEKNAEPIADKPKSSILLLKR